MDELPTIREAVEAIERGKLTPIDLLEHCLARIEQFDERVRAWVLVDHEGARREAERLTQLAQQGEIVGPLHGVPIGVKDIIDVAGMPTKAGSPLRENISPAEQDAPVVANLRKAGAILLGKTVTTEWACFDPPPTRNPWNLNHTPGGSSSGSAAAVAMEMCMAALGTQTGGSIIRPAAYCGVCGLKPKHGSMTMSGIVPVSDHLDHVGPLARCADDLYLLYAVLMESEVLPEFAKHPRAFARLDRYFLDEADESVRDVFQVALARVFGEAIPVATVPDAFDDVRVHHRCIMAVEAASLHRNLYEESPERFGPKVASLIREGLATPAVDYKRAVKHRKRLSFQFLKRQDPLFVTPATPTAAPGLDTTGDARFNLPWSYLGHPAVTIPCGTTHDGLPVGMQIVGRMDADLLWMTRWIEKQLGFAAKPSMLAE